MHGWMEAEYKGEEAGAKRVLTVRLKIYVLKTLERVYIYVHNVTLTLKSSKVKKMPKNAN
jgi:hypothetical protein